MKGAAVMKRSRVNEIIAQADSFIRSHGYILPPFAYWSADEMKARRAEIGGIVDARLGWDITDYGLGKFDELGLFLFTTRNGNQADLKRGGGMLYLGLGTGLGSAMVTEGLLVPLELAHLPYRRGRT